MSNGPCRTFITGPDCRCAICHHTELCHSIDLESTADALITMTVDEALLRGYIVYTDLGMEILNFRIRQLEEKLGIRSEKR